ncbi:hypothetical protein BS50DRAFT_577912 [Corynespora cassiicola Philippines]|uniref:Uncharacterized protein n=1 Tax=Corynespora cassiicola Philippines TaxID=1448308 RepID=A0A2T2N9D9_CORCC|nr:hypothetical protein BS50DRAFT_577912 [Corynespora cassiicola Philippines]
MAFLRNMSDRFWSFVNPRKTQQRRDKPFKAPATPLSRRTAPMDLMEDREMSPETLFKRWHIETPRAGAFVDHALLPPSPPGSLLRPYTDPDGDIIIDDFVSHVHKGGADWDANEETLVAADDGQYLEQSKRFDPDAERRRRVAQASNLRASGWSSDSVFLFQKLGMRGFEPLCLLSWLDDFETLPSNLFTENMEKAFIKPYFDPYDKPNADYRAQLAFQEVLLVSGRVRDAILTEAPKRTPEWHIHNTVMRYYDWAVKDGDLDLYAYISVFESIHCRHTANIDAVEQRMIRKLQKLSDLWQEALEFQRERTDGEADSPLPIAEVPTLYGVISSLTIMFFVSYVPATEPGQKPTLRTVANFDLGLPHYDVWNSLAIAIFVVHCRNRMLQLREFLPANSPEVLIESDPDL